MDMVRGPFTLTGRNIGKIIVQIDPLAEKQNELKNKQ
jgi:hypothetical protein